MRSPFWPYFVIGALVAGVAIALWHQQSVMTRLRADAAMRRSDASEHARLKENNRRLLAGQPSDHELDETEANAAVVSELKAAIAQTQQRAPAEVKEVVSTSTPPKIQSLEGSAVSSELWQNAGRETPAAAFQTALWAASKGNLDELVASMSFEPDATQLAHLAFSRLSPAQQRDLGSPERMIALLTALDVPAGRAMISRSVATNEGTQLAVQLTDHAGQSRTAVLSLRAESGQWKFKVPASAVARYTDELSGLPAGRSR